jgi:hypothetical protein
MAGQGSSLPIIGRALGHRNTSTTNVYARLALDPVLAGMEMAAEAMLATRDLPEKLIPITAKIKMK